MTLGRIGIIAGAHLLVLGGGYFVTKYGNHLEDGQTALAGANGLVTWSSQGSDANAPTVADGVASVADPRAADLDGYNGGAMLYAAVSASAEEPKGGRFTPRRPSGSSSSSSDSTTTSTTTRRTNDTVLRPVSSEGGYNAPDSILSSEPPSSLIEYKVQSGDSLWGIAQRFNVSVNEIVAANPGIKANQIRVNQVIMVPRQSSSQSLGSSSTTPETAPAPVVNGSIYTVKKGDSLSTIASRQGVTVNELKAANNLPNDVIRIGQELVVPGVSKKPDLVARQHTGQKVVVEPGDTLGKIAAVFGVSATELQEYNNITDPRSLKIGQVLLIPGTAKQPEPQPKRLPLHAGNATTQPPPPPQQQPAPLDTLDTLPPANEKQESDLPTLDDAFQAEDLEDQPLVPIQE